MLHKKLKRKILLDLRLLIIFIPTFILGFLSSPLVDNKIFKIHPLFSGLCGGIAIIIGIYFIISWLFYDYFYKDRDRW